MSQWIQSYRDLPMLRGWCDLPVALSMDDDLNSETLMTWASAVRAAGRQPVLLGLGFDDDFVVFEGDFEYLENKIEGPPREWEPIPVRIMGRRLGSDG